MDIAILYQKKSFSTICKPFFLYYNMNQIDSFYHRPYFENIYYFISSVDKFGTRFKIFCDSNYASIDFVKDMTEKKFYYNIFITFKYK